MLSAGNPAHGARKESVKFTNASRDGPIDGSRRESVAYTLKYVLSALDALGVVESDDEVQECRSPNSNSNSLKKIDLQPVITTLRAIGNINDYRSSKDADSKPIPYSLDFILTTLEGLGENDDDEDEDWDYDLNGGLNEKQLTTKIEIEGIVSSLTAFERENSKNDLEMLLTETEAKDSAEATISRNKDFDLQYVVNSLYILGENGAEAESYLQSLNPARKNSLVKCNLQYVLALLKGLGEPEEDESRSFKASSEKKCMSPSSKSMRSGAKDDKSYNNSHNSSYNSINNSNRNSGKHSGSNSNLNSNNDSGKNISNKNKSCKTEKKNDSSNDSNNSENDNDEKSWQSSIEQTVGSFKNSISASRKCPDSFDHVEEKTF